MTRGPHSRSSGAGASPDRNLLRLSLCILTGQDPPAPLRGLILLALAMLAAELAGPIALAQEVGGGFEPQAPSESDNPPGAASDRLLVEQKLRLLQSYLGSVENGRLSKSGRHDIQVLIAEAQAHLVAAEDAFGAGDLGRAAALTDQGLVSIGKAASAAGPARTQESDARKREHLARQRRQIQGYLAILKTMLQEPGLLAAHKAYIERVESLLSRSVDLESRGSYTEANALLSEAYPITLKVVAELHQGKTLVAQLHFDGPEDEFRYEVKRYESYELLVWLAQADQGETSRISTGAATDRYLSTARRLRGQAEEQALSGQFDLSIVTMEQATQQLVHALRASGAEILY